MAYLVDLYNNPTLTPQKNHQELQAVLKNIPHDFSEKVKRSDTATISLDLPFPKAQERIYKEVHQLVYPKERFITLHKKAKSQDFTLNDCLLTAYMRMLATY